MEVAHRRFRMSVLVALLALPGPALVVAPAATPVAEAALPVHAAVLDVNFPDPDIVKVGSYYYAYATQNEGDGYTVQRARSTDLRSWTWQSNRALSLPRWAKPGKTWAPEVFHNGNGLVMWFTAHHADSDMQCIGVATASGPEAVFEPTNQDEPTICETWEGGSIDAAHFRDPSDGQRYILWKNDGNRIGVDTWIYTHRITSDGTQLATETGSARLIKQDKDWEWNLVEAPTMRKVGSTYVLYYSAQYYGECEYRTSYATSSSPMSGFSKAPWPLMTDWTFNYQICGPGGQDVVTGPDGKPRIVFHGWKNGTDHTVPKGYRAMFVQELGYAGANPVVAGSVVKYEAEHAVINNAGVRTGASGASNDAVVAWIDYSDSWVEFRNLYVPRSGTITFRVRYAAGAGDASYGVYHDGGWVGWISLPHTGWDNWRDGYIDIYLTEGYHTIRFTKGANYAEFDRLDVW